MKNLKNNFKNNFNDIKGKIFYQCFIIIITLLFYNHLYDFLISLKIDDKLSATISSILIIIIYYILLLLVIYPIKNVFYDDNFIVNVDWNLSKKEYKDGIMVSKDFIKLPEYTLNLYLSNKPVRPFLVSFMRHMGAGICLYSSYGFVHFNSNNVDLENTNRCRQIKSGKQIFIGNFDKVFNEDINNESGFYVPLSISCADSIASKSNINYHFVIGTKYHKIKVPNLFIKSLIINDHPLKVKFK
ncbi:hypothetical protein DY126_06780 [Apilactobacillus micheneri]|nr:hypothetical protein DY126_06780 [Apilactobacillus micheneri]